MGDLTPHFDRAEVERSETAEKRGISNRMGPAEERAMVALLLSVVEPLRMRLGGKALRVTSGFRSQALNDAIKGKPGSTSQHIRGEALDLMFWDGSDRMPIYEELQHMAAQGFPIDQAIVYDDGKPHVHISATTRRDPRGVFNVKVAASERGRYGTLYPDWNTYDGPLK